MIVEMFLKWLLGYENKQQRLKLRHYDFTGITFYYKMTKDVRSENVNHVVIYVQ